MSLWNYHAQYADKAFNMNTHHVSLRQIVPEIRPKMDDLRRGGTRRELKKRGRGMKDRVDKSMGIVTRITEALTRIKPTEPLVSTIFF